MADNIEQNKAIEEQEEAYDTSDPKQVNTARKKAARTRADRLRFVKAAMENEEGRAWFYDLLVRCHVINTPFQDDPYLTAFRCGEQNIGLQLMKDIQDAAANLYIVMTKEARNL